MIVEYIKGSILDAPQKYIAHGVNCQNVIGSGVAKVLFEKYPDVKNSYHKYCTYNEHKSKKSLLGECTLAVSDDGKVIIFNCFTQENYGYNGKKYVSYDAIYKCFYNLSKKLHKKQIAIPKIGCGLAGGNWNIVSQIIDDATGDDLDVYVYYLK